MEYKVDMEKIPFYMTFPMQNLYVMEMEYEKDLERMKSLYPQEVKKIMPVIEQHCDELEFEGSRIYDEEPDAFMMQSEAMKLYDKIREKLPIQPEVSAETEPEPAVQMTSAPECPFLLNPPKEWEEAGDDLTATQMRAPVMPRPNHAGCDGWLCSMVGILFQDEIYRRRCRKRRCHRWW